MSVSHHSSMLLNTRSQYSARGLAPLRIPLPSHRPRAILRKSRSLSVAAYNGFNPKAAAVVLVGDIGGTNARLSLWKTGASRSAQELHSNIYPTEGHATFEDVLDQFLKEEGAAQNPPQAAALAIAGAVADNICQMTNCPWLVDGGMLEMRYGFRVALLNDFEAVGYGIPALDDKDMIAINNVPAKSKAPKVVMGPGTGLGAAQLMWDEESDDYKVWPGEGSHGTFAPRGWKQAALAQYATSKLGHVEIEQVACGSGLELIYEFLLTDEIANRPSLLRGAKPKTAEEVSASALDGSDPLAVEAVDMFLAIVGAEAGNMALRCLAKGGVYIAGGITPRLMERVQQGGMLEAFLNPKVRSSFHQLLRETPLYVITNQKVGQIGAREIARKLTQHPQELSL